MAVATADEVQAALRTQDGGSAIGALTVAGLADNLEPRDKAAAVQLTLSTMSEEERKEVLDKVLPQAPRRIWYLIISGLFVLSLVFGWMAWMLIDNGKAAEAPLALATAALGGILGLLAPGPTSR